MLWQGRSIFGVQKLIKSSSSTPSSSFSFFASSKLRSGEELFALSAFPPSSLAALKGFWPNNARTNGAPTTGTAAAFAGPAAERIRTKGFTPKTYSCSQGGPASHHTAPEAQKQSLERESLRNLSFVKPFCNQLPSYSQSGEHIDSIRGQKTVHRNFSHHSICSSIQNIIRKVANGKEARTHSFLTQSGAGNAVSEDFCKEWAKTTHMASTAITNHPKPPSGLAKTEFGRW